MGSRVITYINFCLQVHFKVSAAWYCSHYLTPVSIVDTRGKFATGINNTSCTGGKICRRCRWLQWCRWHRGCTLTCEYLREFCEKIWNNPNVISAAWGKVIHEKNLKQKISWHSPFKHTTCQNLGTKNELFITIQSFCFVKTCNGDGRTLCRNFLNYRWRLGTE